MTRPFGLIATTAIVLAGWVLAVVPGSGVASACPFCPQVAKTFSEEFSTSDVVVVAKLLKLPPPPSLNGGGSVDAAAIAKFEVSEVIKGAEHLKGNKTIATAYFGDGKAGQQFLLMGADPQQIVWTTPLPVTERGVAYFKHLKGLPEEGAERLAFFQDYLEDSDDMLARDAFDEFARAPYQAVKDLAPQMDHDQILAWIKDTDIPASHRRLYFVMLGVCGSEADLPLLESMLRSDDRKFKAGLDSMVACYLTLGGASQLPTIDELFLKNPKAEYADTYAAIMALRFHGSEADVIPRKDLINSMRYMLARPQLADLVIPDLAKWEDWDSMERLVALFKSADEKSNWVRVPVINFLRACPRPEAKQHLKELEKIDPNAFKRANTFFPGGAAPAAKPAESSQVAPRGGSDALAASGAASASHVARGQNDTTLAVAAKENTPQLASISRGATRKSPAFQVNRWQIAGVLAGGGLGLALVMGSLLFGHASVRTN